MKRECRAYQLIEVFPVVLGHQTECTQHGPAEVVKVGVAVVGITAVLFTLIVFWARSILSGKR